MTVREALERIIDMAWDARHGLARMQKQHDVDADALEIIEDWLLVIQPLEFREVLEELGTVSATKLMYPEISGPLLMGLLEYYKTLKDMEEVGL